MDGQSFVCYQYWNGKDTTLSVSAQNQDWYLILRNYGLQTHILIDFSINVSVQTTADLLQIVTPDTSVFEMPIYNVGDTVLISGIATTDFVTLSFDDEPFPIDCPVVNGEWSYAWNTSGEDLGTYIITATHEEISDERTILLIDALPPYLSIDTPIIGTVLEQGILTIAGQSSDNLAVDHIEVTLNNITRVAFGTTTWNLSWNLIGLPLGDYLLSVKAIDAQNLVSIQTRSFVLNESGHIWGPQIINQFHSPTAPTNTSNVIVYANVTTTAPFNLESIVLFCDNGTDTTTYQLYRYGDFPIQSRHEEDPLQNQSNTPIFGRELGQFSTGQVITYWIIATDTAQNTKQSAILSFTIA
jgi:hypothetical protein